MRKIEGEGREEGRGWEWAQGGREGKDRIYKFYMSDLEVWR